MAIDEQIGKVRSILQRVRDGLDPRVAPEKLDEMARDIVAALNDGT